jgi:hypothetical protein
LPRLADEGGQPARFIRRNFRLGIAQIGGDGLFQRSVKNCADGAIEGGFADAVARMSGLINKFAPALVTPLCDDERGSWDAAGFGGSLLKRKSV